jgi:hypothetical protein
LFHSYISAVRLADVFFLGFDYFKFVFGCADDYVQLADVFFRGFDYFKFVFGCADGYVQGDYHLKVVELVSLIGF